MIQLFVDTSIFVKPLKLVPLYAIVLLSLLAVTMSFDQNTMDPNGSLLSKLRNLMVQEGISGYIIPHNDDHQSEFVGPPDQRITFISGFEGSAGTAVVTLNEAFLWTDSRYYLQAEKQLHPGWTLIRTTRKKSPNIAEWLVKVLKPGDKVASDPKKISYTNWKSNCDTFNASGIEMVALKKNLIDELWVDRPSYPKDPVFIYEEKYAGESLLSKIARLRESLTKSKAEAIVVTALDEIAWLLNLRGYDVPYTPVFVSYLITTLNETTLYLLNTNITDDVNEYLQKNNVALKCYKEFWPELEELGKTASKILIPSSMNYSSGSSYLVYSSVAEDKVLSEPSPIINMKAYKNKIEAEGMRRAHIRDAVALCQLFDLMETQIPENVYWDEIKVASILDEFRAKQDLNRGASFKSIVAFGKNGALPHYTATPETNLPIDNSSVLTIDSGGQYLDGTIDTTRVIHFGQPNELHRKVYTLLLRGVIDLASSVFPVGITMQEMEFVLRRPLYQHGLGYGHGSTHGTGVFLGVHESFNYTYDENFIGSQEPGYYKDNEFGMRLENLVIVVPANVENFTSKRLLTFEPLTLVPYERKLINVTLLDKSHIDWINEYHQKVRKLVGEEMLKQKKDKLYQWLCDRTNPIGEQ